jgi:hypothetical protein
VAATWPKVGHIARAERERERRKRRGGRGAGLLLSRAREGGSSFEGGHWSAVLTDADLLAVLWRHGRGWARTCVHGGDHDTETAMDGGTGECSPHPPLFSPVLTHPPSSSSSSSLLLPSPRMGNILTRGFQSRLAAYVPPHRITDADTAKPHNLALCLLLTSVLCRRMAWVSSRQSEEGWRFLLRTRTRRGN